MRTGIRSRLAVGVAGALAVVLLIAGALGGWHLLRPSASAAAAPMPLNAALDPPAPPDLLVYVSGAVAQPGLYRLPSGARVADAIGAAGGFTADADPGRLPNLAARIHDAKQINVPFRRGTSGSGSAATVPVADRVDVNTATADELSAVPGMPLGLPEAIVDERNNFGPFATLAQLKSDLGLDSITFAAIRPYLRASNTTR